MTEQQEENTFHRLSHLIPTKEVSQLLQPIVETVFLCMKKLRLREMESYGVQHFETGSFYLL